MSAYHISVFAENKPGRLEHITLHSQAVLEIEVADVPEAIRLME
jgi:hypothetical protein